MREATAAFQVMLWDFTAHNTLSVLIKELYLLKFSYFHT